MMLNGMISMAIAIVFYFIGLKYLGENRWKRIVIFIVNIAVALAVVYLHRKNLVINLRLVSLLTILWPIAINDYKEQKIPNQLLLIEAAFVLGTYFLEAIMVPQSIRENLFSGLVAGMGIFLVCMICILIFKNSIGMGDIKLFMVMGLLLGVNALFSAIFFSLIISFFVACYLLIRRKKDRKDHMSFGPAILVGTTISILLGGI